jgi:hypothetical protein
MIRLARPAYKQAYAAGRFVGLLVGGMDGW